LPAETTSFVDRRAEAAEVKRLLGANRLVTLVGVGGVGKTRLALRVASEVHRSFGDGVCYVGLGMLSDGALVGYEVAASLRLDDVRDSGLVRLLATYLADRHLLLVMDNCEHVIDACAEIAVRLLPACRGLRILCTSRQPLEVAGETLCVVAPLPVDGPDVAGEDVWDDDVAGDDGTVHAAAALFAERAAAVVPGFTVSACWLCGMRRLPITGGFGRRSTGASSCANRPNSGCGPD
jgi:non-specific serine/threonine protein kinase